jgi:hypothetical protein
MSNLSGYVNKRRSIKAILRLVLVVVLVIVLEIIHQKKPTTSTATLSTSTNLKNCHRYNRVSQVGDSNTS